ncbi:MAG: hypothetical protein KDD61_09345 [Bdellovibrionales bacterium]|nr:hypothetical protein [Bdellovibrionales bacterium]
MKLRALILVVLFSFSCLALSATTVITDTLQTEGDGSRIFLSMSLGQMEDFKGSLSPQLDKNSDHVFKIFIPQSLTTAERAAFKKTVIDSLEIKKGTSAQIELIPLDVELLYKAAAEVSTEIDRLDVDTETKSQWKASIELTLEKFRNWKSHIIDSLKEMKHWKRWPTEQRIMLVGSFVGIGKSIMSIGFWIPSTGANIYGYSQAAMSLFLDVFFARWGHRVEAWKGRHLLGRPNFVKNSVVLNKATRFYNQTPVLKAFVVDNLIAISAGAYFRALSYAADTTGTIHSPLSMDFAQNILGGMTIGGISGAAGGQGVRTLRRKGYIGPKTEYALFQLFGLGMQIGGFLNGAGMSTAFWVFLKAEAFFKFGLYFASRALPNRKPRTLVFHEGIPLSEVKNIQYQHGLYDSLTVTPETLSSELQKHSRDRSWLTQLASKWKWLDGLRVYWNQKSKRWRCRNSVSK